MPDACPTDLVPQSLAALLTDDIRTRLRIHAMHVKGALAVETVRALRADGARYAHWCAVRGMAALPTAPETLRAYVLDAGTTCTVATVRRHVASIAHLHRAAELPDPSKAESVRMALRTLARAAGTRPRQAAALTENAVDRILATACGSSRLVLRDRALLLVARDVLARRGELVALLAEDLVCDKDDGSATILIRRSKTDQEGAGSIAWLSPRAVRALTAWLAAAGIVSGPLFRSLRGGRVGGALPLRDVARRLKALAARAGLDASMVSGHSARVGMAQDLIASGAELPAVMQAGRWKTPAMPAHYAERLLASRGAVARYHEQKEAVRPPADRAMESGSAGLTESHAPADQSREKTNRSAITDCSDAAVACRPTGALHARHHGEAQRHGAQGRAHQSELVIFWPVTDITGCGTRLLAPITP